MTEADKQFIREMISDLVEAAYEAGAATGDTEVVDDVLQAAQDRLCRALGLPLEDNTVDS